jgi:hypothetical protein
MPFHHSLPILPNHPNLYQRFLPIRCSFLASQSVEFMYVRMGVMVWIVEGNSAYHRDPFRRFPSTALQDENRCKVTTILDGVGFQCIHFEIFTKKCSIAYAFNNPYSILIIPSVLQNLHFIARLVTPLLLGCSTVSYATVQIADGFSFIKAFTYPSCNYYNSTIQLSAFGAHKLNDIVA